MSEDFLVPLVKVAIKTGNVIVVNCIVAEICCLPEVKVFGRSVARVSADLEGDADLTPEATALSMVGKIIGSVSNYGSDNFPSSLAGCLKAVSDGVPKIGLSPETIVCEYVLLKALKDSGVLTGAGSSMLERFLLTFLRTATGGIGTSSQKAQASMNIRLRAKTAGLQVQFSRTLNEVLKGELVGKSKDEQEAER